MTVYCANTLQDNYVGQKTPKEYYSLIVEVNLLICYDERSNILVLGHYLTDWLYVILLLIHTNADLGHSLI